jgi:hypothetical protein
MSIINATDISLINALTKNSKAIEALTARQSGISYSKENGMKIDETQEAAKAAAKYDNKIKTIQKEIAVANKVSSNLTILSSIVNNLDAATQSLRDFGNNTLTTATPDDNLKNSISVKANYGASSATHDVKVIQVAKGQQWVLEGLASLNNDSIVLGHIQPFTSATDPVVFNNDISDPPIPGFYITDGEGTADFNIEGDDFNAVITLNADDSLHDIADKINEEAQEIGVIANVVKVGNNAYQLVLENSDTGSGASFQVVQGMANNLFRQIYSHPVSNNAISVDIYSDANMNPWAPIDGFEDTDTFGYDIEKQIVINGVAIQLSVPIGFRSIEGDLKHIVNTINSWNLETNVNAKIQGGIEPEDRIHITLTRTDGLAGIDIQIPLNDEGRGFVSPSQLFFTGTSPDAIVEIDGIRYTSPTNTFTPAIPEGDIASITVNDIGNGKLLIGQNSGLKDKIVAWIDASNKALQFLAQQNEVDIDGKPVSELFGYRVLTELNNLITAAGSAISSNPNETTIGSLRDIGISFQDYYPADPENGEVSTKYLTINHDIFDNIISNPTLLPKIQALFRPYFSAISEPDFPAAPDGAILSFNPDMPGCRIEPLEGNAYTGQFKELHITLGMGGVEYVVDILDNDGNIVLQDAFFRRGALNVRNNGLGGIEITDPGSGFAFLFTPTLDVDLSEGFAIPDIEYLPPTNYEIPDNNAKLSLTSSNGFNITDFDVNISCDEDGEYHAQATYKSVSYDLIMTPIGLNSFTLRGENNTPFARLQMNYSSDGLINNQNNKFNNIIFKSPDFALKAERLKNYLDPKIGILYSKIKQEAHILSEASKKLTDFETIQTQASDNAKARLVAIQMEMNMLDEMQNMIIAMITGKSADSGA